VFFRKKKVNRRLQTYIHEAGFMHRIGSQRDVLFTCLSGEKMMVKKRYLQVNEELFREHPEFLDPAAPSLEGKLAVVASVMPGLVAAAAEKAIAEWGRPAEDITHLVFATSSSAQLPHIDLRIASLLGLSTTVQRTVIGFHGCSGSSAALRVAKDIAENNRSARVLVACADMLSVMDGYLVPNVVAHRYGIIGHAIFGDGAGAVVVGSRPQEPVERPIFEMVSASQATLPGSELAVAAELTNFGMEYRLEFGELAAGVGGNIERCLIDTLSPARRSALVVLAGITSSGRCTRVAPRSWTTSRRLSG
jgi:bisdemethoxycurcumin synthase